MIIVRLMGGLGNQMFQYAAGLRLAMHHCTTLKLDLTLLLDRTPQEKFVFREFDLPIFGINGPIMLQKEIRRILQQSGWPGLAGDTVKKVLQTFNMERVGTRLSALTWRFATRLFPYHLYFESSPRFHPAVLDLPANCCLEGYFQNESYFADIASLVRERFHLKPDRAGFSGSTRMLADKIQATPDAVCLNVRRGDYVTHPVASRHHGVCGMEYFERALAHLDSMGIRGFNFVFSDDVDWCRENFGHRPNTMIVSDEHAGWKFSTKFWLMTQCRHFIIPNSSFGWWAAWLNEGVDKVVIRPSRWFHSMEFGDVDVCPHSWIKISNE